MIPREAVHRKFWGEKENLCFTYLFYLREKKKNDQSSGILGKTNYTTKKYDSPAACWIDLS